MIEILGNAQKVSSYYRTSMMNNLAFYRHYMKSRFYVFPISSRIRNAGFALNETIIFKTIVIFITTCITTINIY